MARSRHERVLDRRVADEHAREALRARGDPEDRRDHRAAEVAVDEDDPLAGEREGDREIDGRHRLRLAGDRARDEDRAREAAVLARRREARAERPVGLAHVARQRLAARQVALHALFRHPGDAGEDREPLLEQELVLALHLRVDQVERERPPKPSITEASSATAMLSTGRGQTGVVGSTARLVTWSVGSWAPTSPLRSAIRCSSAVDRRARVRAERSQRRPQPIDRGRQLVLKRSVRSAIVSSAKALEVGRQRRRRLLGAHRDDVALPERRHGDPLEDVLGAVREAQLLLDARRHLGRLDEPGGGEDAAALGRSTRAGGRSPRTCRRRTRRG